MKTVIIFIPTDRKAYNQNIDIIVSFIGDRFVEERDPDMPTILKLNHELTTEEKKQIADFSERYQFGVAFITVDDTKDTNRNYLDAVDKSTLPTENVNVEVSENDMNKLTSSEPLKIGDTVKIMAYDTYLSRCNKNGDIIDISVRFAKAMKNFCGQYATITEVYDSVVPATGEKFYYYELDIDNGKYNWALSMFCEVKRK